MGEKDLTIEILQRLTRIEENTKSLDEVSKRVNEAYSKSVANEADIAELKDAQKANRNWLMGIIASIIIYLTTNFLFK